MMTKDISRHYQMSLGRQYHLWLRTNPLKRLTLQTVVYKVAAAAASGTLLEMQTLVCAPGVLHQSAF